MNLLAFDTSTEIMSIAVQRTVTVTGEHARVPRIWQHSAPGGAQTSAHLIPGIERLMAQAQLTFNELDAIVFGNGPGSFTGLRTACAVAQGLALGANIKVLPIGTLLAVAEEARHQQAPTQEHYRVLALLDARMDEMYAACYEFNRGHWHPLLDACLIQPESLVWDDACTLAGNVFAAYGARLPAPPPDVLASSSAGALAPRVEVLPGAGALLRLAPALLASGAAVRAEHALPHYIRDKVAKTTLERAAEQLAR